MPENKKPVADFVAGTSDVERAASQLIAMYGREKAIERARELEQISAVNAFARAVRVALEGSTAEDGAGKSDL